MPLNLRELWIGLTLINRRMNYLKICTLLDIGEVNRARSKFCVLCFASVEWYNVLAIAFVESRGVVQAVPSAADKEWSRESRILKWVVNYEINSSPSYPHLLLYQMVRTRKMAKLSTPEDRSQQMLLQN